MIVEGRRVSLQISYDRGKTWKQLAPYVQPLSYTLSAAPVPVPTWDQAARVLAATEGISISEAESRILAICHRPYLPPRPRPLVWSRHVSPRRAARRAHARRMKRRRG